MFFIIVVIAFNHRDCQLFGGIKNIGGLWKHPHWNLPYEPNVVNTFNRIVNENSVVLDIGANVGGYSIMSAMKGAQVMAVEMQPVCVNVMRCLVESNNVKNKVHILHGFISTSKKQIMVPTDDCEPMGSPEAVAGRWPVGVLRKKNYELEKSKLQTVYNLNLGKYITQVVDLVKIDTEGCEIDVLKSLKNKWSLFKSVIIEFQPGAWAFHNVSKEYGTRILKKFIRPYKIFYLGHKNIKVTRMTHINFMNYIKSQNIHTFEEFLFTNTAF